MIPGATKIGMVPILFYRIAYIIYSKLQANKWIKRGMSLVPCKYYVNLNIIVLPWPILISIYENDGSVAVTHGGIEMGHGINTKVAQVEAFGLGLSSASEVSVKPADGLTSANACVTGGSMSSELVCQVSLMIVIRFIACLCIAYLTCKRFICFQETQ